MDGRENNAFTMDVTCFSQAVAFYTNLFAATPTGRPHAHEVELKLSDSTTAVFHTGATFPTAGIIIETPNLDAAINKIMNEGAAVELEVLEAPNGLKFNDRYGYNWTLREIVMDSDQILIYLSRSNRKRWMGVRIMRSPCKLHAFLRL
ncbi:unnamed protein product [Arabidopsis halleri]